MGYLNKDGLWVRFGTEKIVVAAGGEYPSAGDKREVEVKVDISKLTTTQNSIIAGFDGLVFDRNTFIEEVEVMAEVGAATITSWSFGLSRLDRTTELDYDGFVAAQLLATIDTAGERTTLTKGSTGAGALIGTTLAYPGLPVAYIAGATGTGILKVRVKFYVPGKDANPTNY